MYNYNFFEDRINHNDDYLSLDDILFPKEEDPVVQRIMKEISSE